MLGDLDLALRLGAATVLGGLVGIEREIRGRRAGLRTHILVSLGACLFTLTSVVADEHAQVSGQNVQIDITRIASQIVVGVGFLGGGAILRHGATVRGLTTAASLWITAAIGLACGFGFYRGAVAVALLTLFCLAGLRALEERIFQDKRRRRRRGRRAAARTSDEAPTSPLL